MSSYPYPDPDPDPDDPTDRHARHPQQRGHGPYGPPTSPVPPGTEYPRPEAGYWTQGGGKMGLLPKIILIVVLVMVVGGFLVTGLTFLLVHRSVSSGAPAPAVEETVAAATTAPAGTWALETQG